MIRFNLKHLTVTTAFTLMLLGCCAGVSFAETDDWALPEDAASSEHCEPVVVDTETGMIKNASGNRLDPEETIGMSAEDILSCDQGALCDALEEDGLYAVQEQGSDTIQVAFPFANKRLLVFTKSDSISNSFGAIQASYYAPAQEHILDYATEREAAEA